MVQWSEEEGKQRALMRNKDKDKQIPASRHQPIFHTLWRCALTLSCPTNIQETGGNCHFGQGGNRGRGGTPQPHVKRSTASSNERADAPEKLRKGLAKQRRAVADLLFASKGGVRPIALSARRIDSRVSATFQAEHFVYSRPQAHRVFINLKSRHPNTACIRPLNLGEQTCVAQIIAEIPALDSCAGIRRQRGGGAPLRPPRRALPEDIGDESEGRKQKEIKIDADPKSHYLFGIPLACANENRLEEQQRQLERRGQWGQYNSLGKARETKSRSTVLALRKDLLTGQGKPAIVIHPPRTVPQRAFQEFHFHGTDIRLSPAHRLQLFAFPSRCATGAKVDIHEEDTMCRNDLECSRIRSGTCASRSNAVLYHWTVVAEAYGCAPQSDGMADARSVNNRSDADDHTTIDPSPNNHAPRPVGTRHGFAVWALGGVNGEKFPEVLEGDCGARVPGSERRRKARGLSCCTSRLAAKGHHREIPMSALSDQDKTHLHNVHTEEDVLLQKEEDRRASRCSRTRVYGGLHHTPAQLAAVRITIGNSTRARGRRLQELCAAAPNTLLP
ncbi:hypothetical protein DFH06DRAFT_1130495 [Mycena polygramma]|nr:hypothetical protein DFH06DRAFT_1130495 [Mycena polygramma]